MFVRVNVGKHNAPGLEQGDLRRCLGFNLRGTDAPGEKPPKKRAQRGLKAAGARIYERGKLPRGELRLAIHQNHVTAHAQRRRGASQLDGFSSGRGARHQRGAGEQPGPVHLDDGAIDPGGQSKVIGIEDETAHGVSLSTMRAKKSNTHCCNQARPKSYAYRQWFSCTFLGNSEGCVAPEIVQ